ncbi:tRNA (N6-threonylcarbamoyladenosine(37)-N6)-methyltransferase TrmO [Desulfospira joergensenii]|uniref:tRNA (N6-threonylcarbamoyladenosine(37)-N6)-methyltransferase TrmO n=1 Tax=Desulfospira joergensenii TaxID=53329 RepID=UPI0003B53595|nr:tRNA (N6-threonylcarbamoyladenosine(37)-N6)-methyltransferase TrmO [Desulfospira joergensenii]
MEELRPEMILEPVGRVESPLANPTLKTDKNGLKSDLSRDTVKKECEKVKNTVSRIRIFEPWTPLLKGIEDFSHILVLYWPHLIDPEKRQLKQVHPMGRKDIPKQGIFATCSPARPNPILVSAVRLLERRENILQVQGLEAVNQSPVIDIKPYSPHYLTVKDLKLPEWMANI